MLLDGSGFKAAGGRATERSRAAEPATAESESRGTPHLYNAAVPTSWHPTRSSSIGAGGRNRSRTCDLFLVMEALVPTELCARVPAIIPALYRSSRDLAVRGGCAAPPAPRSGRSPPAGSPSRR